MNGKKRYSVTLSGPFQTGLNELVKRGIYIDVQDAIREFIRDGFEKYGIDPFTE